MPKARGGVPGAGAVDGGDHWRRSAIPYHLYELHVMLILLCTLFVAW